uniref:GST N-terminal domain-containing protein n=1 Tax=Zea mays TaxID=4577 RepID=A0A804LVE9_MAIZE
MAPPAAPTALHHRTPLLLPRRTVALGATATARAARAASLAVRAQPDTTAAAGSTSAPEPTPEFKPPPGFKAPEPKRYEVKSGQVGSVLGASLAIPLRLGTGVFVLGYSPSLVSPSEIPSDQYALEFGAWKVKEESKIGQCKRPEKPIEIYEFEGCPFCRKRDGNSLGPRCIILPLSSKGPTFRPKVLEMGGKKQFPYMVDPNTGVAMYESDDIIKYLADTYGDGTVPIMLSLGLLTAITAGLATLGRIGKGNSYIASKVPPQPIEIWACEGSPFCKLVRETLVELELPHLLHSCARGSPKRQEFFKKKGLFQVGRLAKTLLMHLTLNILLICLPGVRHHVYVCVCVTVLAGAVHRRS